MFYFGSSDWSQFFCQDDRTDPKKIVMLSREGVRVQIYVEIKNDDRNEILNGHGQSV